MKQRCRWWSGYSQDQLPALPFPLLAWWWRCLAKYVAIPASLSTLSPE
jgi:hypothetical protein